MRRERGIASGVFQGGAVGVAGNLGLGFRKFHGPDSSTARRSLSDDVRSVTDRHAAIPSVDGWSRFVRQGCGANKFYPVATTDRVSPRCCLRYVPRTRGRTRPCRTQIKSSYLAQLGTSRFGATKGESVGVT
jgi:hypothetical protein